MLYQIKDGSLSFGEKVILNHVDMEIKGKEKIGIVGSNGTGKTTLLNLIAGEYTLDRDDKRQGKGIVCSRELTIGTLSQDNSKWHNNTIEEILLEGFGKQKGLCVGGIDRSSAGDSDVQHSKHDSGELSENIFLKYSEERFHYEQKYDKLLQLFGFRIEDKQKKLQEFSGGEQTKVMVVKLLLSEADLLLLDEPTNHLDEESVEALENYLTEYPRAVVVVSHDRYFLDRIADVIYELEDAKLTKYNGNYSAYRVEKRKQRERQWKAYERQQAEIEKNEQLIRQFKNKPRKAAFARSRKTMLNRMERIEKPKSDVGHIFTGELKPEYPGPKWMLQMEKLQIGFSQEQSLLGELDLRVKRGQKIGIIGKNGIGKSTLLRTLMDLMKPIKGKYQFGERVEIGFFDQNTGQMESEEKVVDYFKNCFPGMLEKDVYGTLASYLFKGSICQHRIHTLSGGEKARLKLCELLTICPNFLILDEPTNHMDIPAKETLESAFQAYTGTMLIVSHDRYFLDQIVDSIIVLEEGGAYFYPFGYSHYIQKKHKMSELLSKGVALDELPGILTTQEQAMVASLKAVPKARAIASRQLTDEEAYLDWKLRLVSEPMDAAKKQVQIAYEKFSETERFYREKLLENWENDNVDLCLSEMESIEGDSVSENMTQQERLTEAKNSYENAMIEWTKTCLDWYDVFIEDWKNEWINESEI